MNPSSDSGCELGTGYFSVLIHKMAMIIPTTKSLFLGGWGWGWCAAGGTTQLVGS